MKSRTFLIPIFLIWLIFIGYINYPSIVKSGLFIQTVIPTPTVQVNVTAIPGQTAEPSSNIYGLDSNSNYEILSYYNDRIIFMTDIFINVLVTVILFILGFNIYTANSQNTENLKKLELKIDELISQKSEELKTTNLNKLEEHRKTLESFVNEQQKDNTKFIDGLHWDVLDLEASYWKLQGTMVNALSAHLRMISLYPNNDLASSTLQDIFDLLHEERLDLTSFEIDKIQEATSLVRNKYPILCDSIIQRVKAIIEKN